MHFQIPHIVEDIISEDDKVAVRITFKGTFINPLFNHPPTGKSIESTGTVFYRTRTELLSVIPLEGCLHTTRF